MIIGYVDVYTQFFLMEYLWNNYKVIMSTIQMFYMKIGIDINNTEC